MKKVLLFVFLLPCFILSGCTKNISPNTYSASEVGVANKVTSGVIISRRPVNIEVNSGIGATTGAVAGGAAGSLIGGDRTTNVIGAVGGAVAGGLIGNAVEKGIRKDQGYEYIIKIDTGSTISVTQTKDIQFGINQ